MINPKLWSATWWWSVVPLFVWAYLALTGEIIPDKVDAVATLILGYMVGKHVKAAGQ
jgi:hypothetical protein